MYWIFFFFFTTPYFHRSLNFIDTSKSKFVPSNLILLLPLRNINLSIVMMFSTPPTYAIYFSVSITHDLLVKLPTLIFLPFAVMIKSVAVPQIVIVGCKASPVTYTLISCGVVINQRSCVPSWPYV